MLFLNKHEKKLFVAAAFCFFALVIALQHITSDAYAEVSGKKNPQSLSAKVGIDKNNSKLPIFVTSDNLKINSESNSFTYKGNVKISQGDTLITSDIVVGKYDQNNQLKDIVCQGNVVISKGADLRATSNRAHYLVPYAKVILTEAPEVNNKGNVLTAEKITVFLKEERSEAEGNVRVKVVKQEGQNMSVNQIK